MTREETKEAIKVMQAYVDGAEIEVRTVNIGWHTLGSPIWNWDEVEYRIKQKELVPGRWYRAKPFIAPLKFVAKDEHVNVFTNNKTMAYVGYTDVLLTDIHEVEAPEWGHLEF